MLGGLQSATAAARGAADPVAAHAGAGPAARAPLGKMMEGGDQAAEGEAEGEAEYAGYVLERQVPSFIAFGWQEVPVRLDG